MRSPTVDIHAHFYPDAYLDALVSAGYPLGTRYASAPADAAEDPQSRRYAMHEPAFTDIAERLARMNAQGVDAHALSLPPPDSFAHTPRLLEALCRAFNDAASAAHVAHPDRFVVLASLPVHTPEAAIAELERARGLPGVRGVCLGTRFGERELSDPAFFVLWERIAQLRLPVFLHYAPLMVIGTPRRLHAYHLGNVIGNTTETAIAASHLIFGGVLDRLPALEVSLPHAGGVLPILAGRLDRAYAVRSECRHLPCAPSEYLRRFRFDTVCHSQPILEFLVRLVGADRVMLGSDYCFDMGDEQPVSAVHALKSLTADDRARILGGTAARLLRIE
jgi:aminocarboxymuconate-semialdehyde decarboxylase